MSKIKDWNNKEIEIGISKGGVISLSHPFDNLIKNNIPLWPPPEIVQKMYKSRQIRAFAENNLDIVTTGLGYYCDLQSMHSEDAITWNVFGPVKYAPREQRIEFVRELLDKIDFHNIEISDAEIWMWRRIPHPDTLVSGGPEIDFGVITDKIVIIGEAKWLSGLGKKMGKNKDKDQIQLRIEFIKKYGKKIFKDIDDFIVLGLSDQEDIFNGYDVSCSDSNIHLKNISWDAICDFGSHPCRDELKKYYNWKKKHSKMKKK